MCLVDYEQAELVSRPAAPAYQVELREPRLEASLEWVGDGLLVAAEGTRSLIISETPQPQEIRMLPTPANAEQIAAAAALLASVSAAALTGLIREHTELFAANPELSDALRNSLSVPMPDGTCEDLATRAWRLESRILLGEDASDQDRMRLALRSIAQGCDPRLFPPSE